MHRGLYRKHPEGLRNRFIIIKQNGRFTKIGHLPDRTLPIGNWIDNDRKCNSVRTVKPRIGRKRNNLIPTCRVTHEPFIKEEDDIFPFKILSRKFFAVYILK